MHLDAHALLTLLRFRLGDVFRSTLTFRERNYISGLMDTRNRWAHQLRFSADDTYRTLDDMERLLAAVSAPQSAALDEVGLRADEAVLALGPRVQVFRL
jgi:hypothetical protein